jgi:hypothetical protein
MYNYELLENGLRAIVARYREQLKAEHLKDVTDFIDVGEYGEAFDLLCCVIANAQQRVPADVYETLATLGREMRLDEKLWTGLLPLKD